MKNIQKITQLQNEISLLVAKEVKKLETISLIPDNFIDEMGAEYWDWLYDLPKYNLEDQWYYIIGIYKTLDDNLYLNLQNQNDSRSVTHTNFYQLSLSDKIDILYSVNNVIEYNKKLKQTL